MTSPGPYRCPLGRLIPDVEDAEKLKRDGWIDHAILVVHRDDPRLTRIQRQAVMQIGKSLYDNDDRHR